MNDVIHSTFMAKTKLQTAYFEPRLYDDDTTSKEWLKVI